MAKNGEQHDMQFLEAVLSLPLLKQCGFRVDGCSHGFGLKVRVLTFINPFIKVTARGDLSGSGKKSPC